MTWTVQAFVNFFEGRAAASAVAWKAEETIFVLIKVGRKKNKNKPAVDLGDDYRRALDFE